MHVIQQLIGAFFIAFTVVLFLTPSVRKLAIRLGVVDEPNPRRINKVPIPGMGGLAIVAGFWIAVLLFMEPNSQVIGLMIGCSIITLLGFLDDMMDLSPWLKFLGQFAAAFVVIAFGYVIPWIRNPLGTGYLYLGQWSMPLTALWIVGVTNAVNFIDGLDGLAAGTSAIASLILLIVSVTQGDATMVIFMAALAGSCIAFLRFNFNPAKIFMGDTGALSLGFLLATISVNGLMKSATTVALIVPVLALGLPILDTVAAVLRRVVSGKSPFHADRGHLHHRLIDSGLSQRQAVSILYVLSMISGSLAVILSVTPKESLLTILSVVGITFVAVVYVGFQLLRTTTAKKRMELGD